MESPSVYRFGFPHHRFPAVICVLRLRFFHAFSAMGRILVSYVVRERMLLCRH